MKKFIVSIMLIVVTLLFGGLTFAQDEERDLKSPNSNKNSKETTTAKTGNAKTPKTAKKTIAVSNFYNAVIGNDEPQIGRQLIALFEDAFTKNGTYQVVATQQIQKILKEQDSSMDERMDPSTAAKIGKIASANVYVFGNITEFTLTKDGFDAGTAAEKTTFNAKLGLIISLVDVNTGITLKSVNVEGAAEKSSTKVMGIGKKLEMTPDLRIKLFTEAANKAVKIAVNELSPVIQNSDPSLLAAQAASTPQPKTVSNEATRTMPSPVSNALNNAAKVTRVISNVVYLSGLGDVKVGDILSVVRGAGAGKEVAVIEVTEVNERTAKAKIVQGSGVQAEDRVKVIQ